MVSGELLSRACLAPRGARSRPRSSAARARRRLALPALQAAAAGEHHAEPVDAARRAHHPPEALPAGEEAPPPGAGPWARVPSRVLSQQRVCCHAVLFPTQKGALSDPLNPRQLVHTADLWLCSWGFVNVALTFWGVCFGI